jgi:hypothetical protein
VNRVSAACAREQVIERSVHFLAAESLLDLGVDRPEDPQPELRDTDVGIRGPVLK